MRQNQIEHHLVNRQHRRRVQPPSECRGQTTLPHAIAEAGQNARSAHGRIHRLERLVSGNTLVLGWQQKGTLLRIRQSPGAKQVNGDDLECQGLIDHVR